MHIKINMFLPGYITGDIIKVEDDGADPPQPKDLYWVRRLKDAEIDNCCEIFTPPPINEFRKVDSDD